MGNEKRNEIHADDLLLEGCLNLANAIVTKAVNDYRAARKDYDEGDKSALATMLSCERFFKSEWGDILCRGKAKYIWERLQKEYDGTQN